jgi:Mn2+/Fe2+ NRAMP family transporter
MASGNEQLATELASASVEDKARNTTATEDRRSLNSGNAIRRALAVLGPGLVTGASDDDPSGIATYSQVGAQFGYGMLWTMVFSYPLMGAI